MSPPPSRQDAAGRAYNDVRMQAKETGRPTQQLLQLYLLESFLRRLANSQHRDRLILKGGVLLAAWGDRRPTKDVDLQARQLANDLESTLAIIREVAALPADDGVVFGIAEATAEVIREDADYEGIRIRMPATLATARLRFAVDVSAGDPIDPPPQAVTMPCLLGNDAIEVLGYPMVMVLAEKLVTALQRGAANTRWRDFADLWTLSRHHDIDGDELQAALRAVARHRAVELEPLTSALDGFASLAQERWAAWRANQLLDTPIPEDFGALLVDVAAFADDALEGSVDGRTWLASRGAWSGPDVGSR